MARRWHSTTLLAVAAGLVGLPGPVPGWAQTTPPTPPAGTQQQSAGQGTAKPKPAPADENAFPEAQSEAAEKATNAGEKSAADGPAATPDAAGSGDTESSSRSRMKGIDLLGDKDTRTSDGAGGVVHDPKLAKDDIRVGQLYMANGDYPGAYSRFKEATQVSPENADAVFYLAEAARKTAHLDEAAANYKIYLDADPKGKRAKDAHKALQELAGK